MALPRELCKRVLKVHAKGASHTSAAGRLLVGPWTKFNELGRVLFAHRWLHSLRRSVTHFVSCF